MTKSLSVAIGGFGAIGMAVARKLDEGIEGLHLAAISARDREAAAFRMQNFRNPVPVMAAGELAEHADIVVECAPAAIFTEIAEPALKAGRIFIPLSIGQLLEHPEYEDLARRHGARIIAPTGALLGLDAVRAAAEGTIESVTMVTRKPPGGLAGAPYLEQHGISVEGLTKPLKVFDGTAREAARGFPANVNVAAALSLAGTGPDRTMVEIWADPTVTRNTHVIKVEADSTRFEMKIEGVPSPENPRTGLLTPLSVIATLRALTAPMRVGT
ncbi:MAG: aspartate dehydrogenase [Alphaproteobacteria bacterium]|jgi:aspartate dehydrogenase|nr:aspartate dehydrogenase [Alphaproteobacteria bacterium]